MTQINPKEVLGREMVQLSEYSQVQQVGIDLSLRDTIHLEDKQSVNVTFNETIKLPEDAFALFYVRSSFSRKGVFVSSGVYDPGYEGSLGCSVYNLSGGPITIDVGQRIGQIICFKADSASTYNGQWQGK